MSLHYEAVLYKSNAVLFGQILPTPNDFSHAVLVIHDHNSLPPTRQVLDYTSDGIGIDRERHVSHGNGWYECVDRAYFGTVMDSGTFPETVSMKEINTFVYESKLWDSNAFCNSKLHNCLAFVIAMVEWALCQATPTKKRALLPVSNSAFPLTAHLGMYSSNAPFVSFSSSSTVSSSASADAQAKPFPFVKRLLPPASPVAPLPVPSPSHDTVTNLLNSALAGHSNMSAKQDLIGFIFSNSGLPATEVQKLIPTVSLSTIKQGLRKANLGETRIETKRMDTAPRDHVKPFERKFFRESMLPFFMQPLSGSVVNKAGVSLLRTSLKPLGLYSKYVVRGVRKMVDLAAAVNNAAEEKNKPPVYTDLTATPRGFAFFKDSLLKPLIHYREERNVSRCHYCDSYVKAKADMTSLLRRQASMEVKAFELQERELKAQLRVGERHTERLNRQNGYICSLRYQLVRGQCLIQCDYFSFYSYLTKVNILGLVVRYLDGQGVLQIEHVHYVSNHPHDFYFSATGFEHAFAEDNNILANSDGQKFNEVIITGDTAMFKGPFLGCLREIAVTAGIKELRCVPFCTKHGPNEVDGDGGRVKPVGEQQVLNNEFDEKNLASFCADIMALFAESNCRAFPITGLIAQNKPRINAMFPEGDVKKLWPPKQGYGEIILTNGPGKMQLWCRTDVNVPEPWKLGHTHGYPLPEGRVAPTWALIEMGIAPSMLCLPCSALTMKTVAKDHAGCVFSEYTKYMRCGLCGQRKGHNVNACPRRDGNRGKINLEELKSLCRKEKLHESGKQTEILRRLRQHYEKSEENDNSESESESDLSDEFDEEFDLTLRHK